MEVQELIQKIEQDIMNFQARPFDIYILPAFVILYSIKSKTGMSRLARRILFTSGVYMGFRNYSEYKKALAGMSAYLEQLRSQA